MSFVLSTFYLSFRMEQTKAMIKKMTQKDHSAQKT